MIRGRKVSFLRFISVLGPGPQETHRKRQPVLSHFEMTSIWRLAKLAMEINFRRSKKSHCNVYETCALRVKMMKNRAVHNCDQEQEPIATSDQKLLDLNI